MRSIILKIAFQDETSANDWVTRRITPETKIRYKIPENAEPFTEGNTSAVYENTLGQIVAFTDSYACNPAYKSIGKNSEILPEIYDLDEIELSKGSKFCVITMEKLTPLNRSEKNYIDRILEGDLQDDEYDTELYKSYDILIDKMVNTGIEHMDLHAGNVAWSKNNELKLIDWEAIAAPQDWI